MRVRFYGVRGSIATPGPSTVRYGGNTVCVELRLADGSCIMLDAGTGARELGKAITVLHHHDPDRGDDALDEIGVNAGRWAGANAPSLRVLVAREGMTLEPGVSDSGSGSD